MHSWLVGGIGAAMTTRTAIGGLVVSKRHNQWYPYIGSMAGFAQIRGLRMGGGFVRPGTYPIMATCAAACLACYRPVVKQNLQPIVSVMAHIASLGGRYMCEAFAGGYDAVMTVFTQIRSLSMIYRRYVGLPAGSGGMAGFTQIRSHRMRRGFMGRIGAIMTRGTAISALIMRKRCI